MNIEKFYLLSSKLKSSTFQAQAVDLGNKRDNKGLFDQHKLIIAEYDGISFPVTFKQKYGRKLEDLLDTGWPGLFLISEKFKEILEDNGFTGWQTFDIRLVDKHNQLVHGYCGLSIKGRCGKIDYNKSEIIEKRLVPNGPLSKYYKGLYIDLASWDGHDFFLPEQYFGTIITDKTAASVQKAKLTNISLESLLEIETPTSRSL